MPGNFFIGSVDCKCHKLNLTVDAKGNYFCRDCNSPARFCIVKNKIKFVNEIGGWKRLGSPIVQVVDILESENRMKEYNALKTRVLEYERMIYDLRNKAASIKDDKEYLDKCLQEKRKTLALYESQFNEINNKNYDLELACIDLKNKYESLVNEKEGLEKEWQDKLDSEKESSDTVRRELKDVRQTNTYLSNELKKRSIFQFNDIVKMFVEYASNVYNSALDCDSTESMKENILFHTERLQMLASGLGINIGHYNRGDTLTDGRVDIEEIPTDSKELDMKVCRSDMFRCTFKDDLEQMIPERIVVYRFHNDEAPTVIEEETTSDPNSSDPSDVESSTVSENTNDAETATSTEPVESDAKAETIQTNIIEYTDDVDQHSIEVPKPRTKKSTSKKSSKKKCNKSSRKKNCQPKSVPE